MYVFVGFSDIGYSWLIGEDGAAYEGRGWGVVGAHTRGYNSNSYAFSVMGNFMNRNPNAAALRAVRNIIACGVARVSQRNDTFTRMTKR